MDLRLALALSFTLCLLPITGCCSSRWGLGEEGEAALAESRGANAEPLELEVNGCGASSPVAQLLDRAAWILGDEELALIDYTARIKKALTDDERQALTTRRTELIAAMISQVYQLNSVVHQEELGRGASSIALVLSSTDVQERQGLPPAVTAAFDHVSVVGPSSREVGIVVPGVSARVAMAALVDDMERFAREKDVLTHETRERLAKE